MWGLRAERHAVGQGAEGHLPAWPGVENRRKLWEYKFGSCVCLGAEGTGAGMGSGGSGASTVVEAVVVDAEGLRSRVFVFAASVEP